MEIDTKIDKEEDDAGQTTSSTVEESHSSHFNHHDYTVGWICVLPKEQTAATAMLDQIHPNLPKPSHDRNAYTLGRMGKHNVVIACLPKGQYATIPAAKVATWMTGTFPSIRVGLMVGIGGGVPPKVQLGDVVVSTPTADYPGVVQWDQGKAEEGGHFKRTGSLNNPPTVLLTALAKLETQHDIHGTQIPRFLDDMINKWPNLASKYLRPDLLHDPLVGPERSESTRNQWSVIFSTLWRTVLILLFHLIGWATFTTAGSGHHEAEQVAQKTTNADIDGHPSRSDGVHVHYGLIASGNQVIKDAQVRDTLNESLSGNVLCVEMEAAGLMNDFPCIVIRGICDYADSRKNKEWQEYAAAVAAGCAKELLEVVDPVDVKHMPEARAVIHER